MHFLSLSIQISEDEFTPFIYQLRPLRYPVHGNPNLLGYNFSHIFPLPYNHIPLSPSSSLSLNSWTTSATMILHVRHFHHLHTHDHPLLIFYALEAWFSEPFLFGEVVLTFFGCWWASAFDDSMPLTQAFWILMIPIPISLAQAFLGQSISVVIKNVQLYKYRTHTMYRLH